MNGRPVTRIIMVGPMPPPFGGMANQTRQLVELLRGEGLTVDLIPVNSPYRPSWVARIPVARAVARLLPYLLTLWRATGHGQVMHVMANSGWSWHLFAAPAIVIARMHKVPVVVNYRGGEAEGFMAKQSRWVLPVLRMADRVAVPSGFLQQVFGRYDIDSIIIPNIVDLSRFGAHAGQRPPIEGGPHLIVTRNLEALYDNATAIRAFEQVHRRWPDARLTIAGSGPEREALQALVRTLGLEQAVSFPGRLERDDMAQLYASADVMLNPSLADNTPNSVLEAWASGVAVVSTDVGGVRYLVDDGVNAVLVPPSDADAMATAVSDLLDRPERREARISAGLIEAQRFDWSRVRPLWLDCYGSLGACAKHGEVEGSLR